MRGTSAAKPTDMTDLPTISIDTLADVTGGSGADWGSKIGGLIDKFTGGKYGAAQKGGQLGGWIDGLNGGGGGGGDGGGSAPQAG